jgi:hypothetical protein
LKRTDIIASEESRYSPRWNVFEIKDSVEIGKREAIPIELTKKRSATC